MEGPAHSAPFNVSSNHPVLLPRAPALQQCSIYLHTLAPEVEDRLRPKQRVRVSEDYFAPPAEWEQHQLATEIWLHRALATHPWRARRLEDADIAFVVTNRTQLCQSNGVANAQHLLQGARVMSYSERLWEKTFQSIMDRYREMPDSRPKPELLVNLQDGSCVAPAMSNFMLGWGNATITAYKNMFAFVESLRNYEIGRRVSFYHLPTVFVVPTWRREWGAESKLAAAARVPWAERKLILFVGHVPKLCHSKARYFLWKQLRRDPRATVHSYTINCTVGSYAACKTPRAELLNKSHEWFITGFCKESCQDSRSKRNFNGKAFDQPVACGVTAASTSPIAILRHGFLRRCKHYKEVNWKEELPDMARPPPRWSYEQYLGIAASHRFCLVAMGDAPGTPKIVELIQLGARGGCIPVIVIPGDGSAANVVRILPFVRWLDYCKALYLVPQQSAAKHMRAALMELEQVSAEEAAAKHAALRAIAPYFSYLGGLGGATVGKRLGTNASGGAQSVAAPSAADLMFAEACERIRARRELGSRSTNVSTLLAMLAPPAGSEHSSCMLGAKSGLNYRVNHVNQRKRSRTRSGR